MPGPQCDRCVSEIVLHWTVLINNFIVCQLAKAKMYLAQNKSHQPWARGIVSFQPWEMQIVS